MNSKKCGIKHKFGDARCIRAAGHDGLCRSRAVRGSNGTISYCEWESRDGKYHSHVGYTSTQAKNAVRKI